MKVCGLVVGVVAAAQVHAAAGGGGNYAELVRADAERRLNAYVATLPLSEPAKIKISVAGGGAQAACPHNPVQTVRGEVGRGPLRYTLRCPVEGGWRLNAQVLYEIHVQAALSATDIARGQSLTEELVRFDDVDLASARGGVVIDIEPLLGLAAQRQIRAGQVLQPKMFAAAQAIKRGEAVLIVIDNGDVSVGMAGVAEKDGRIGETIPVRNSSSDKVLNARVIGPGKVSPVR